MQVELWKKAIFEIIDMHGVITAEWYHTQYFSLGVYC